MVTRNSYTAAGGSCSASTGWLLLSSDRSVSISSASGDGTGSALSNWTVELSEFAEGDYNIYSTSTVVLNVDAYVGGGG
jgi:hypothetical protein